MKIFRKALLTIIVLSAVVFAGAGITEKASGAVFPDISADSLFYPHIERLFKEHFVSGDTRSGTFRPSDTINRAEFAKITAYTRLAEEYGTADNWSGKDALSMAFEIFGLLKPYFGCGQGACVSIGGVPFTDVKESDPKCMDDIGNPDACEPWFSRYVYYAVSKGYIKGYADPDGTRSYRPTQNILRIHALKMMIVDNGNILPESDSRYQRLLKQAVSLGSYTPKCLKGAENYIKDLNGGNTADAEKLLKYALLADRLDLFGNRCEVFGSYRMPAERALFLQKPLTRGETPRYFAIITAYSPVRPNAADTTINTSAENSSSPAGVPSYKMPVYEKTPLYNRQGGDESVWGDGAKAAEETAPEQPPLGKTITAPSPKAPVYDPNAPYTPLTDSARPSENIKKAIAKAGQEARLPEKGLPSVVITAGTDIALTGEYGENCGSIPAGEKFNLLIARKGEDGEFYQYTDYNKDLICRFPCNSLMTPACRIAVAEDNAENPSQGNTVVGTEEVATMDIMWVMNSMKIPMPDVYTDTVKEVKAMIENPMIIPSAGTDYWYTVIPGWQTKDDGLWGGVFSRKRYDKHYLTDTLFPQQSNDKFKELIVKVIGDAEPYNDNDPNASAGKTAMITNYRTDRWYRILYINPYKPKEWVKTGYVPVSGTVLKDSNLFSVGSNGYYELANGDDYQSNPACLGAYSKGIMPVDKILLHNTNGASVMNLKSGCAVHYYLARNEAKYGSKFVIRVPEYLNSATAGIGDSERRAISVEMVNWEWTNPAFDEVNYKNRIVKNSLFHDFNLNKIKEYKINDRKENTHIFTAIQNFINEKGIEYRDYDLVNYYFQEKDGFFEVFNHNGINADGENLKKEVRNDKTTFDRFYTIPTGKNFYKLKPQYQSLIDSNSDPKHELIPLYAVLNKIPFGYNFYQSKGRPLDYTRVIDPKGTFPLQTYTLPSSKVSQPLDDGKDADYYEKYTQGQYDNLNEFISHMNLKYGIPLKTFENNLPENIPAKYGFYFFDKSTNWNEFSKKVIDFKGIISHRISTSNGKMCPAPGFQIDRIAVLTK